MLTGTIESVLNRGLPRSPRAQQLCAELAGRTLTLEIRAIGRMQVQSTGSSLKLRRGEGVADARIVGGPLSLLALTGPAPDAVLQRGAVRIDGDVELAQKFRELGRLLRPDLEEELSLLVGDVSAHRIGRLTRIALDWTRRAAETTVRNVAEYLAHERQDLVSRSEADRFLRGVDTLREDVDRLGARLDVLVRKSGARSADRPGAHSADRPGAHPTENRGA
ncbi:MAG: ubiquinone biosynthesis accessory factor UbiJ [Steroidobacteraceae bacterium]